MINYKRVYIYVYSKNAHGIQLLVKAQKPAIK